MSTPHPAEQRRLQNRAEARRLILEAAEDLLREDGPERFSMRRLAERCGVTAPTIYHYFGDKQGLLDALLEAHFRELVALLRQVEKPDPLDCLRAYALAFANFGIANPSHYALLTAPRPSELPPPPAAEEARILLERPLTALHEERRLGVEDLLAARQSFWALLHGLITLRTSRRDIEWGESVLETAVDALIRGLVRDVPAFPGDSR